MHIGSVIPPKCKFQIYRLQKMFSTFVHCLTQYKFIKKFKSCFFLISLIPLTLTTRYYIFMYIYVCKNEYLTGLDEILCVYVFVWYPDDLHS